MYMCAILFFNFSNSFSW